LAGEAAPAPIPAALREYVIERAGRRCEYCLVYDDDSYLPHHVDHIISRKHGGASIPSNLAYACYRCNLWKGTDLASVDAETGLLAPLYHPRQEEWSSHFRVDAQMRIQGLTPSGRATAALLKFNLAKRVEERAALAELGRYPEPFPGIH